MRPSVRRHFRDWGRRADTPEAISLLAPFRSCAVSGRIGLVTGRVGHQRHRACSPERAGLLIFFITLLFSGRARAEPGVELSGGAGFGVLAAGVTSGRFAISP